ncbi:MAG TPA: T9SS type A sorting domain-containing protein [Chitinophagales bacterium]|nr:T9SS type A sorting domain-containing protein [Chitinophagales bacterium]
MLSLTMTRIFFPLFIFTLLITRDAKSQKQGDIWYFAEYGGLDFSSGTPVIIAGGQIASPYVGNSEGCSVISDSAGNLLLYASPNTVWNRNHQVMPNGNGLLGGISSTQGVLIVPKPGSSNLFYVFTQDQFQNNLANGLRYSVVDMCLDGGLGDIVSNQKNILLLDSVGEKLTAAFHSNGTDIWLVTRKHFTNEFYSYLITQNGISSPVISSIGWANPQGATVNSIGQMKISPDGSKLAFALENQSPSIAQLFNFNDSTGEVTNMIDLPILLLGGFAYGVAFSPDNSKLYIKGVVPTGLVQFDLSSGDSATIVNSMTSINASNGPGPYGGTGLQLANNGKIYGSGVNGNIDLINDPNESGDSCHYLLNAIVSSTSYTFPGFIDSYEYNNGVPDCFSTYFSSTDSQLCEKFCTSFTDQSNNNPTSWLWQFPGADPDSSTDQNPFNICYNTPGIYNVTLITISASGTDTFTLSNYITVYPTPPFPIITQVGYTLTSSAATSYQWQFNLSDVPGATNQSYTVLQSGYYTVVVRDSNDCKNSTTLYVLISGIDDVIDADISIYPNPATERLMVELLNGPDFFGIGNQITLTIFNTIGQVAFSSVENITSTDWSAGLHSKKKEIDLSKIARGVYFLELKNDSGVIRNKILIIQ